jgi:hypothetical protein
MSERLIALTDAATASCHRCAAGIGLDSVESGYHPEDEGSVKNGETTYCMSYEIRLLVESEHLGLGSRPISEWRAPTEGSSS